MQIHDKEELFRKVFHFLSTLVLVMVCNGCFTSIANNICYRCHDDIQILERRGELSTDGESLSIHLKMRKDYCRDPFGIWKGSIEEEETHVYPLTNPEPHAERMRFSFFATNSNRCIIMRSFEVKDGKELAYNYVENADYNKLILPVLNEYVTGYEKVEKIFVHRDELPFLSRPYIIHGWSLLNDCEKLVIPYKLEDNVYHVYLPRKDIITPLKIPNKPNVSTYILGFILVPPAVLLDALTSPLQFIIVAPLMRVGK